MRAFVQFCIVITLFSLYCYAKDPSKVRFVNALERTYVVQIISDNFTVDALGVGNCTEYFEVTDGMVKATVLDRSNMHVLIDTSVGAYNGNLYTIAIFLDSKNTIQLQQYTDSFENNGDFTGDDSVIRFINLSPTTTPTRLRSEPGDVDLFGQIGYTITSTWQIFAPSSKTQFIASDPSGKDLPTNQAGFTSFAPRAAYTVFVFSKFNNLTNSLEAWTLIQYDRDYNSALSLSASLTLSCVCITLLFSYINKKSI
jgi:hypothetical protein